MRYQSYVHERNWGARITEFIYHGYAMVALDNRFLRIVVAAGKGTDIVEFLYKPLDVDFMWRSYAGLRASCNFNPTIANPNGASLIFTLADGRKCSPMLEWTALTKEPLWGSMVRSACCRGPIT